jgi:hypothetical protein
VGALLFLGGGSDVAGDEDNHASLGARGLAVDGGDGVLAQREGERGELAGDVGGAHELGALEGEHGAVLVERRQPGAAVVERRVVVVDEGLRQRVGVHRHRRLGFRALGGRWSAAGSERPGGVSGDGWIVKRSGGAERWRGMGAVLPDLGLGWSGFDRVGFTSPEQLLAWFGLGPSPEQFLAWFELSPSPERFLSWFGLGPTC